MNKKMVENKILLKNGTILDYSSPAKVYNGDIQIENGLITEVGEIDSKGFNGKVIDLRDKFISSGHVCSHNHFYSSLARGITSKMGKTSDFISILRELWWKLDIVIDEEILYYSSLVGALEAIKCGTTAVIDHHASPSFIKNSLNTIEKTFIEAGLRGILCYEVTNRNGEEGMIEGVEENLSFSSHLKQIKKENPNYLIESAVGGHASFTLGDRALSLLSMAIDRTGRGIHIHVAEDKYDVDFSLDNFNRTPMQRLNDFGLLNEMSILAHCVHVNNEDLNLANEKNAFIVHNPRSNMNNRVGYYKHLRDYRNSVLGTDGIGSGMFEELKLAFYMTKEHNIDVDFSTLCKSLHLGNSILNKYFNSKFGKVAKGYKADLTIYDYCSPTLINSKNLYAHMVFGLSEKDVSSVIINGQIVYHEREFPFETKQIYKNAQNVSIKLWEGINNLYRK